MDRERKIKDSRVGGVIKILYILFFLIYSYTQTQREIRVNG